MKIFIIGFSILLVAASFFSFNKKKPQKTKPLTTINATLNGIDQNLALTMIDNFSTHCSADKGKKSVSVWFNTAQIKAINDLLTSEANTRGTDGLRFYFGSDKPIPPNTKLHVKVLLVSTIPKAPTPGHLSTHGDYYDHTGDFAENFLLSETGITINDQADLSAAFGAHLFNPSEPTNGICNTNPTTHYLSAHQAYNWVKERNEKNADNTSRDDAGYSTVSDWFKLCFITSLFNVISNPANKLDGLRIYLAEQKLPDGTSQDVIILVPTHIVNNQMAVDDYDCMEGLAPVGQPFCSDKSDTSALGGGYDKGELCPTVCN